MNKDTIAALATAPLAAGVAVIRISGAQAWDVAVNLCPTFKGKKARMAHFGKILSHNGETLDEALVLGFKAPHSFTGEDVVEIQCHGGLAVVESILRELLAIDGVRQAEAGEFSRRAFMNGKMDLIQAEGLADLIAAQTEEQARQARHQMAGEVGNRFERWREQCLHLLAHVEAAIDFPDEELDVMAEAGLEEGVKDLLNDLNGALAINTGERLREGFSVAVVGRPNAGKSTLTNLLTGKQTAIVSDIAGTTRDVVEAHLNIGGLPVVLADTAGLRTSTDDIEAEGIRRAAEKAKAADVVIAVVSAAEWPHVDEVVATTLQPGKAVIVVSHADEQQVDAGKSPADVPVLALNLLDEASLTPLLACLEELIRSRFSQSQEGFAVTRRRHRACMEQAANHLQRALQLYYDQSAPSLAELLAQDLRDAAAAIGRVTGRTGSEDVLDVVFSTFCIGK